MKKFLFSIIATGVLCHSGFAQSSYLDSTFTDYFRRSHGWTAGDATISIALPDGRTMWLFGDSFIDSYDSTNNTLPCLFQIRNCFMIQDAHDPNKMTTYIDSTQTGINRTFFKNGPVVNTVFWPGHGFVYNDTIFVFLEEYNSNNLS